MKTVFSHVFVFLILVCHLFAQTTPPYKLDLYNNPSPGYIFLTPHYSQKFYIVDNTCKPVFEKTLRQFDEFLNPKVQPNGMISFFSRDKYYLMNDSYELIDSFNCVGNYEVDFHDIKFLPNGNTAILGREVRFMDLSNIIPGGHKDIQVIGNVIQEFDKNKNLIFNWNSFDHFKLSDMVPGIDTNQNSFISCHMNSIFYDTDGNIIASSRALDEVTKIDRQSGNIIWRLGGATCKNNQFRFLNDTINGFYGFSHQHSVLRLQNGNLLMLDNGDLKPKPYTRAVEYKIDELNKTIEKVWEYSLSPDFNSYSMGNVQRLPNGNTLIGWGLNSDNLTATEVTPDGKKVLEISDYQNYAVYKYIYKMHAVTLFADKPGIYDFSSDTNITDVKLEINNIKDARLISIEKHDYLPHNLIFSGQNPTEIFDNRWVLSSNNGNDIDALIRFYLYGYSSSESYYESIFFRQKEGDGNFEQLKTTYNPNFNCLEAKIKSTGEFIIGMTDSIMAPITISPANNEKDVSINTKITWQPVSFASEFRLQLSLNPEFTELVIDSSNITNNHLDVILNYNRIYYWRVMAFYDERHSSWSETMMFTTIPLTTIDDKIIQSDISVFQYEDRLILKINNNPGQINITLFDILGNPVQMASSINISFLNTCEIKFNNLNNGIYFYRMQYSNCTVCGKIYILR
ncbi:MAG: hypothetical protein EPN82_15175 [Bacteroidetes bacterium]|nr:MAG: hypothetical protein EPN82_15175 [Bacteroidota bacterium]